MFFFRYHHEFKKLARKPTKDIMLNIIPIWPVVSGKKIFKIFYNNNIRETGPAHWQPFFIGIIMNFGNLQEGHL